MAARALRQQPRNGPEREREKDINGTETMKTARNRNSYSYGYFKYFSRILKVSVSANSLYLYLYGYLVASVFCILQVSACECERLCLHIMGRILFSFSFLCLLSTLLSVLVPIPFAARFCTTKINTLCIFLALAAYGRRFEEHQTENEPQNGEAVSLLMRLRQFMTAKRLWR